MSLSLFIFGVFVVLTVNLLILINIAQKHVQIEVFLKDIPMDKVQSVYEARTDTLFHLISSIEEVDSVVYIDKEEALERFKTDFPEFSELLGPDFNPLPASFIVYPSVGFRTSEYLENISHKISDTLDVSLGRVEEISYGKIWIDTLDRWIKTIVMADLITGIIIAIASIFVIANTIKLNVFARREQIAIMKLVGASDSLVTKPFLLEGSIHGILSGILASSALYFAIKMLGKWAANIMFPTLAMFSILTAIGFLFGIFGSWIALRKYLVDPWIDEDTQKGDAP
ncbi:ABC transporter permease [candidate division WOR-3 bacterium]|nr:ABC transporter permease [candidate division WOR-3 bacterium]